MPVDPPAWVADAVFYQVFPDRFARSGRVPAPGPFEPWDAPPTHHGLQGRRPARRRRSARRPRRSRDHGALPQPGLHGGLEPSLQRLRTTWRSIRSSAATTRSGSCSTAPTRAGCGSCSTGSSTTPDAASSRSSTSSRSGASSPYRDWFHLDPDVARRAARDRPIPGGRSRGTSPPGGLPLVVEPSRPCRSSASSTRRPGRT